MPCTTPWWRAGMPSTPGQKFWRPTSRSARSCASFSSSCMTASWACCPAASSWPVGVPVETERREDQCAQCSCCGKHLTDGSHTGPSRPREVPPRDGSRARDSVQHHCWKIAGMQGIECEGPELRRRAPGCSPSSTRSSTSATSRTCREALRSTASAISSATSSPTTMPLGRRASPSRLATRVSSPAVARGGRSTSLDRIPWANFGPGVRLP